MSSEVHSIDQDPAARTTVIYALSGEAGRLLLANDVSSPRYMAFTYGLEDLETPISTDFEEWEREWQGWADAQQEVARVTADLTQVARYATMVLGMAKYDYRKEMEARRDSLSRLPNRLAFFDQLEYSITWVSHHKLGAERILDDGRVQPAETKRGLGVGKVDMDHFKEINDVLGHPIGDKVVQAIGRRLRKVTRSLLAEEPEDSMDKMDDNVEEFDMRADSQEFYPDWDFIARVGGDEFNVLQHVHERLANVEGRGAISIEEALKAAQARIEKAVQAEMVEINQFLQEECVRQGKPPIPEIKARFGWRNYQQGDNEAIIERETDVALYENKHNGKTEDAAADRRRLTPGELIRIRNIISLLENPAKMLYAYRRTASDLRQLAGMPAAA